MRLLTRGSPRQSSRRWMTSMSQPAPIGILGSGLANFFTHKFPRNFRNSAPFATFDRQRQRKSDFRRCFALFPWHRSFCPIIKDLAYFNGSVKAWKYIEENIDNPMLFDNLFLSGKVDATDRDQMYLSYEEKSGGMD